MEPKELLYSLLKKIRTTQDRDSKIVKKWISLEVEKLKR